jgi:hypothetical protein
MKPFVRFRATLAILVLVSMGAVFFALTGPMNHEMGCPFMLEQEVVCSEPLTHLEHWQSSFLAFVADYKTLLVLTLFIVFYFAPFPELEKQRLRLHHGRLSSRPTLLQELFRSGILNKKEPDSLQFV